MPDEPNDMKSTFEIVAGDKTKEAIKDVKQFTKGTDAAKESVEGLDKALDQVRPEDMVEALLKGADKATNALEEMGDAAGRAGDKMQAVATTDFDVGRFGGRLGQLRGAGMAFGFDVGMPLELGQAAADFAESVPDLVSGLGDMASQAKNAVSSLGAGGMIGGGVLIGAIAALTIVSIGATKAMQEEVATAEARSAAITATADIIVQKDREAAAARVAALDDEAKALEFAIAKQREMEAAVEETENIFDDFLGLFTTTGAEVYRDEARELEKQLEQVTAETKELEGAFGDLTGEMERTEEAAKRQEEAEKAAEEAAREREQMLAERAREADRQAQERTRLLEQQSQTHTRYQDAIRQSTKATQQAIRAAQVGAKHAKEDLDKAFGRTMRDDLQAHLEKLLDIGDKFHQEQAKQAVDANRQLKDIAKEATRSMEDALDERNVLQLLEIEKNRKRQVEDAKETNLELSQDRESARRQTVKDEQATLKALQQTRREDYREQDADLKVALTRQLSDIRVAGRQRVAAAADSYQRENNLLEKKLAEQLQIHSKYLTDLNGMHRSALSPRAQPRRATRRRQPYAQPGVQGRRISVYQGAIVTGG